MKWISVKDKLPEHKELLLVYGYPVGIAYARYYDSELIDKNEKTKIVQCFYLSDELKNSYPNIPNIFIEDLTDGKSSITHWMPLPEKPE